VKSKNCEAPPYAVLFALFLLYLSWFNHLRKVDISFVGKFQLLKLFITYIENRMTA